jgi:hypothetical protein
MILSVAAYYKVMIANSHAPTVTNPFRATTGYGWDWVSIFLQASNHQQGAIMFTLSRLTNTAALLFAAGAATAIVSATPAGPSQAHLMSSETRAHEAWKTGNTKFWKSLISEKFIGWGDTGRLDKAAAIRGHAGSDCAIASYALSNPQMTVLGPDAALITYKATVDGTCGGHKVPHSSWVATAYVREGSQWRATFHAEDAIVDPAAPMKPPASMAAGEQDQTKFAKDANADVLLQREEAVWDAWKDRDAKRIDGLIATNVQFINIFGIHLANKPEALKNWSGVGCDVKRVAIADPVATMLSPDIGLLTFRASADGTCFGQKVGPIWGSSIYVRNGDTWKWTFGINIPARRV